MELVCDNITFGYTRKEAVIKDFSHTFRTGITVLKGYSGSGKTTLMKRLVERFGDDVSVLSHDNYYKRHDEMTYEERCKLNYDEPAALETDLMALHLDQLRQGQTIDCPVYDFTQHNRSNETIRIEPTGYSVDVCTTLCLSDLPAANQKKDDTAENKQKCSC